MPLPIIKPLSDFIVEMSDEQFSKLSPAELGQLAFFENIGVNWGKQLVASYNPEQLKNTHLLFDFKDLNIDLVKLPVGIPYWLGQSEAGTSLNSGLLCMSIMTGGASYLNLQTTLDPQARCCYYLSMLCSGSAVSASGVAIWARACQVSRIGAASEACGFAFLMLGNKAREIAKARDAKVTFLNKWPRRKSILEGTNNYHRGVGFAMPTVKDGFLVSGFLDKIPFQRIGELSGFCIAIYGYYRITITAYRKAEQLISKYQENRKKSSKSLLLRQQSCFLIISLTKLTSIRRRRKQYLYRFAVT